ncbi:NAD(P)H-dependent oxidoreductase [Streptococcus dentiloxodontae]
MKILIIYTHPNHQSFNAAILKQVQNNLSNTHTVKTLDLYAEHFDPALRFDENHKRRHLAKSFEMAKYRDLVTWADHMIFIFPIWWSGMPAMLKGFIDRVFVAGFAYSYKKVGLEGHLQGKSAWVITSHNTPSFVTPFAQDYGKVLKKQILKPCAVAPVKLTELSGVERITDEKRRQLLEKVAQIASKI